MKLMHDSLKVETQSLRARASDLESQVLDLKVQCS